MAFIFRRRIKILPGIHLNVGKNGTSFSFGTKGFTYNIGKKGVRRTIGIPGTGMSWSEYTKYQNMNLSMRSVPENMKVFLASGFGLGLLPLVPGSFGALVGLLWHSISFYFKWSVACTRGWCVLGIIIFSALHYYLTPWAQKHWNDADPKNFVLDEIVGCLCVPLFAVNMTMWWHLFAGFALFRVLDAIKLPGARYVDRNIHTASGVLFDDVISAMYAAFILSIVIICC